MNSKPGYGGKSQSEPLSDWLKQAFIQAIADQTGLDIKDHDQAAIESTIHARIKALKFPFPERYYQLLTAQTDESRQEWQIFISLITNPESYFFRDEGQFNLLKQHILPELIQSREMSRTLRICSAGCSTGEEPYSLAILLRELIPNADQWNLCILGVDINTVSLEKAKSGIFRPWSFRRVDPYIRQRYFQAVQDEYHIVPEIRRMLTFEAVNLVNDPFPQITSQLQNMDLIICRNVFIYFSKSAIARVLEKFYNALQPSGYLLTGHAELYAQNVSQFTTKAFAETLVYQRPAQLGMGAALASTWMNDPSLDESLNAFNLNTTDPWTGTNPESEQPLLKPWVSPTDPMQLEPEPSTIVSVSSSSSSSVIDAPVPSMSETELLQRAEMLMGQNAYNLAIAQVMQVLELNPKSADGYYLMAQLFNATHDYMKAVDCCELAVEYNPFAIPPHYLLTDLALRNGNFNSAKQHLKKIIYLEPSAIAAYLKLGDIYHHEQDSKRKVKMQRSALNLLRRLPPKTVIPELNDRTVAELILTLETALSTP